MFDILSLMNEGKTPDEIAAEFTEALNAAIAEKEKENQNTARLDTLEALVSDICDFLAQYYDYQKEIDCRKVAIELDKAIPEILKLNFKFETFPLKSPSKFFNHFFL